MTLSLFSEARSRTTLADLFGDESGLRYYQSECVELVMAALETEASALYVMATGLGKTLVACEIARRWTRGPVLVFSDRNDLIDQNRAAMEKVLGLVELEQGDWSASPNARFVIGSVDSFHEKRLLEMPKDRFSLVVVDEVHKYLSEARVRAIKHFVAAGAKVIGCTATPGGRSNEKALGQLLDCVPFCMGIEDGIDQGFLVPIIGRSVTIEEVQLDNVSTGKKRGGESDFNEGELEREMLKGIQGIVRKTIELEPNRTAIAFFPGVKSAELAADTFNSIRPGSAAFVCATTEKFLRKRIMADFRAKKIQYLCNVDIAGEGFDAPATDLVILASPTMSNAKYTQRIGRGTRVLAGVLDGISGRGEEAARKATIAASAKPNLVILDFVGAGTKNTLVGLEDALGGNYTPQEVERAKKERKDSTGQKVDPRAALEAARRELQQIRAAQVKATVNNFDPFRIYQLDAANRYVERFGEKSATEKQLEVLRKFQVGDEELRGLSFRAAKKLLAVCFDRSKKKLCTLKQLRKLAQFGITRTDITFSRARMALDYLADVGWGRRTPVDPARLNEIAYGRRESGED